MSLTPTLLNGFRERAGDRTIIDPSAHDPFLTEWRGRWRGTTPLVLAPETTEELSRLMTFAYQNGLSMVAQGGNTGLVGGQIPDDDILILTRRLRRIRMVSADDFALTAEAGVTLAEVQAAAADINRIFPLSIGSEGSCQIGGVLSTNAGGVNVIRYGNARDMVLSIEAVMPDGRIWNGLHSLRKNNVGYDLKHLMIGGEGTLGIITAATVKLFARPAEQLTLLAGVPSADAAVALLAAAQEASGGQVTSFEFMNARMVELVLHHFPMITRPITAVCPFYCLVEFSTGLKDTLMPLAEAFLEAASEAGIVTDGTIAMNAAQADNLWALRHHATDAMKRDPSYCVKCDISVPIRNAPIFLRQADDLLQRHYSGARVIAFGHLGDGNIHFDVLGPAGDDSAWRAMAPKVEAQIHDLVVNLEGSISAEHGIGVLKRDELAWRKSPLEMELMRQIKAVFDPKGLMNPDKLLARQV